LKLTHYLCMGALTWVDQYRTGSGSDQVQLPPNSRHEPCGLHGYLAPL